MKTKEQVISDAYPKDYKGSIDANGWTNHVALQCFKNDELESKVKHGTLIYRPLSLKGIENNNGWKRVESENDLPKHSIDCHFELKDTEQVFIGGYVSHRNCFMSGAYTFLNVIAYRPIENAPKRIY